MPPKKYFGGFFYDNTLATTNKINRFSRWKFASGIKNFIWGFIIDVNFTSGIKNINCVFYPYTDIHKHQSVLALYTQHFPELCAEKSTLAYSTPVGFEPTPFTIVLKQCLNLL